jgi:hypothetical protein
MGMRTDKCPMTNVESAEGGTAVICLKGGVTDSVTDRYWILKTGNWMLETEYSILDTHN